MRRLCQTLVFLLLSIPLLSKAQTTGTCAPFVNNGNCSSLKISEGSTLQAGTCVTRGSTCRGDTVLNLVSSNGTVLTTNDDGFATLICGVCSYLSYTFPSSDTVTIQDTCFYSSPCNGTVGYVILPPPPNPPPLPPVGTLCSPFSLTSGQTQNCSVILPA